MKLSNRLNSFSEYPFSSFDKKIKEVEKKSGRKVLNLGIGSPDFLPSKIYVKKLKQFIDEKDSHLYPGYGAIPELVSALQNWYRKRFGAVINQDELYPLLGAKDGISHLSLTLLNEGDEVLVPDPGYPGFTGSALMIGAKPTPYHLKEKNNFKIDIDELEKKISNKTKCIWVNFPSNPTGQIASLEELKLIVDFAKKYKIWLLYDNAYSEITFDGFIAPSILQIKGAKEIAIEIGSFSKTFSFAGLRMGWVVGNKTVVHALTKIKSQVDSGMSQPLQKLGGYALDHFDKDWYRKMISSYKKRRNIIAEKLKKIGCEMHIPQGALYLWTKIPSGFNSSEAFSDKILKNNQVFLTPGTAFGKSGRNYVRVSFCADITNINRYI